jgi:hypothetical protein
MRRFLLFGLMSLILVNLSFMTACNGSGEPKKKADRSESDWSASGYVKDIEEMKKAGEKGKAPAQTQTEQQPTAQGPTK